MPSMTTSALMLAACMATTWAARDAQGSAAEPFNWTGRNGSADETAYSPMARINTRNVNRLGLAWALDLPGERTLQATPLAIDGILYFTGSYSAVYAVDAVTGKMLWRHDPEVWKHNPLKMHFSLPVNRGVAYADGRIFAATLDGRLLALDAQTGRELWTVPTVSADSMQTINGAPRAFNGKVVIGNAGSDFGARGYVSAFDAVTGRQLWRFYTAPGTPEQNEGDPTMQRAAETWNGDYWKTGTGAAVWDNITFDHDLNRIYVGTGNGPYDSKEPASKKADHLYVASIVALDADTGAYLWHYQTTPRDAWDFDATQQMTLADIIVAGVHRKVLIQAPKNGFLYVLDRQDGRLISAQKTGKVNWADRIDLATGRPVEGTGAHYGTGETTIWPGPLGSHSVQTMSFSPKTRLIYLPYMKLGVRYSRSAVDENGLVLGDLSISSVDGDPARAGGILLAWDPATQKARWSAPLATIWNGGTLATGGGLVFHGTADGILTAYDASAGRPLWRFNAGLGINAAPLSYSVDGRQYVSVLVGYGGSSAIWGMNVGWKFNAQPRRLLTFALGGSATLPPTQGPDLSVNALDDPALQLDAADVKAGHALFLQCAICHGLNLISTGSPAPDLRESAIALRRESLWTVLHDGTLLPLGMPRFEALTETEVRQIHAYIRAGARAAKSGAEPR
jgi:quinohemoprotein ethanol dehydrogenase